MSFGGRGAIPTQGSAEAEEAERRFEVKGLRRDIKRDQTISDITRKELLKTASGKLTATRRRFRRAQKGKNFLFRNRQEAQQRSAILTDQPGRRQTLLTQRPNPLSVGGGASLITGSF